MSSPWHSSRRCVPTGKGRLGVHPPQAARGHPGSSARGVWRRRRRAGAADRGGIATTQAEKSEVAWTRLISEHVRRGQGGEALGIYSRMRGEGILPRTYTLVAALKACCTSRDICSGERVHGHAVAGGHDTDMFVASALVDMYTKCGRVPDACAAFERVGCPDLVLWNAMIMGYAQGGEGQLALDLYSRMQLEGCKPDAYTFVAALKACSSLATRETGVQHDGGLLKPSSLESGQAIHSRAVRDGLELHVFVASCLVDMYVKCGSVVDARHVFERMPRRDQVSWTSMIVGYVDKDGELSLRLFASMQQEGCKPDGHAFTAALKACASLATQETKEPDAGHTKRRCLDRGRAIHCQIKAAGFESDTHVANTLIDMYAACGSMPDARQVFESMGRRDIVAWNAMVMGYAQSEVDGALALQLYACMRHEGFEPDDYTFVAVLKACTALAVQEEGIEIDGDVVKVRSLKKGRAAHSEVVRNGFESNLFVANSLVNMYAKCGSMVDAREVFERMPHHTVVSWNSLIMGYSRGDMVDLALQLYARMQEEGIPPNAYTFVAALKACGTAGCLKFGKEIHTQICRVGLENNAHVAAGIIEMYGKCGSVADAQRLFNEMPVKNSVVWDVLIAGYSDAGDSELVLRLFEEMQHEGIKPVEMTFIYVLSACSHTGLVDKGQAFFQAMCLDYGISPSSEHYNCLADLLVRAGQLDEGMKIVKKMPFMPDIVMWMTILGGCQKWDNAEFGRHAFECTMDLDEKHIPAYVLMTKVYQHTWEENAKNQEMRTKVTL